MENGMNEAADLLTVTHITALDLKAIEVELIRTLLQRAYVKGQMDAMAASILRMTSKDESLNDLVQA
jgi:predicted GNAT superfamily acetyltransferase